VVGLALYIFGKSEIELDKTIGDKKDISYKAC